MRAMCRCRRTFSFFFFNDTATTEIYTLSLHDALPIYRLFFMQRGPTHAGGDGRLVEFALDHRSEEHTSELQSHLNLVCRLLLEKKKGNRTVGAAHSGRQVPPRRCVDPRVGADPRQRAV